MERTFIVIGYLAERLYVVAPFGTDASFPQPSMIGAAVFIQFAASVPTNTTQHSFHFNDFASIAIISIETIDLLSYKQKDLNVAVYSCCFVPSYQLQCREHYIFLKK